MDGRHLQVLEAKHTAWLIHPPLFLSVSQIQFCGMSGELVTNTYRHLMRSCRWPIVAFPDKWLSLNCCQQTKSLIDSSAAGSPTGLSAVVNRHR